MALQKTIKQTVDLSVGRSTINWPDVLAVKGERNGHKWEITIQDGGHPIELTGASATCLIINGGMTTLKAADISGNVVSVLFGASCYMAAGELRAVMQISGNDDANIAVAALRLRVQDGSTDVYIDPDDMMPSITELLSQIDAMKTGTEAAFSAAADAAKTASEAGTQASAAKSAATRANTAASSAEEAASDAILATGEADEATDAANAAAYAANTSAARVENAISGATTAADEATKAADAADDATAAANQAAQGANASAAAATDAAQGATQSATLASTAANRADAAAKSIEGATISQVSIPYGDTPQATLTKNADGTYHIGLEAERGPQGPGYTIKGEAFATVEELSAAITNPEEGDQYNVGATPPYRVHRWTGSEWEDQGQVQGEDGISPTVTTSKANGTTTITIVDAEGTHTATVVDGTNGKDGQDGLTTSVNWQTCDANGNVFISGDHIPISDDDETCIYSALSNLSTSSSYKVVLSADGWTELANGSFRAVTVAPDMAKSQTVVVGPDVNDIEEYGRCYVHAAAQDMNVLTFESSQKPSKALTVNVLLVF